MSTELEALLAEARDPETPFKRLVELIEHPEVEVRHSLLNNPNLYTTKANGKLDTGALEELAKEFPEEVANHPLFVLHALIEPNDEFEGVVMEVMQRTKDVGLIERLLRTWGPSSWWMRQRVASNPSTPVDTLRTLSNEQTESEWWVREAVAKNPSTPVDVLRFLGKEATESHWRVRQAVAQNQNTPGDTLGTLGNEQTESDEDVRRAAQKALADRGLA